MKPTAITVSELNKYIKNKVDADEYLNNVYIKGEISNFKHHYTGHMYFTLKDEMSYDPVRNRRKNSFILSINPFGNSEKDRMNFEVKAGQTYDQYNSLVRTQFEFNTKFKL